MKKVFRFLPRHPIAFVAAMSLAVLGCANEATMISNEISPPVSADSERTISGDVLPEGCAPLPKPVFANWVNENGNVWEALVAIKTPEGLCARDNPSALDNDICACNYIAYEKMYGVSEADIFYEIENASVADYLSAERRDFEYFYQAIRKKGLEGRWVFSRNRLQKCLLNICGLTIDDDHPSDITVRPFPEESK